MPRKITLGSLQTEIKKDKQWSKPENGSAEITRGLLVLCILLQKYIQSKKIWLSNISFYRLPFVHVSPLHHVSLCFASLYLCRVGLLTWWEGLLGALSISSIRLILYIPLIIDFIKTLPPYIFMFLMAISANRNVGAYSSCVYIAAIY